MENNISNEEMNKCNEIIGALSNYYTSKIVGQKIPKKKFTSFFINNINC